MTESAKGHLALIFFSIFVAGNYSLGSMAAPYMDATALMALRFVFAGILMGAIVMVRRPVAFAQVTGYWRYLLLGTVFAVYFVSLFEALKTSSAVTIGAMFTLVPFFTAGFAFFLIQQKTTAYVLGLLSIAAIGAVWVIFRGDPAQLMAFELGRGEKIFFIGVIAHALYVPLLRKLDRGEPVMVSTFGVLAGGSIPLLLFSFPELLATDWSAVPGIVWIALAYIVVFATLITFALLVYANQRLPSVSTMAYTYLVPSWVILWEVLLGHGMVTTPILVGIALTIAPMLIWLRY